MGSPPAFKRIGHGGASALVSANTLESFDAALELGVDMIEFDVRAHRGGLVVAHTRFDAYRGRCPSLGDALAHLARPRFEGLEFNVDVKTPGCEAAVAAMLRRRGLAQRSLVSSQLPAVLERVRALDGGIRTGISVGGLLSRGRHRWGRWRDRVLEALRVRRFDALMAHHALVDPPLMRAVGGAGAELYAWTVDDRRGIERLSALGVSGIVTGDPRLFAARESWPRTWP